ncbi:MAG: hypothetical protein ACXQS2_03685 [Methermicoccaceae archaeon]
MNVLMNILNLDIPDFICQAVQYLIFLLSVLWGIILKYLLPSIKDILALLLAITMIIVFMIPWLIISTPILLLSVILAICIAFALLLWIIFGKRESKG